MYINQNKNRNHLYFMKLALQQAQRVLGNTKTNPAVGCVITKNNHVIAAGHTSIKGRPHAEYNAINQSKYNVKDSNLYVTLEPCSHYGKTPPCVNSISKSKMRRVFFSLKDPDVRSYNKSTNFLKKYNIGVQNGILEADTRDFYKSYFKYKKYFLPFVTSKLAISKDFYSKNKKKDWITNKFSRGRVHLLRQSHDCIITSSKTVKIDNPNLTCRIPGLKKLSPTRIILDKNLKIPINSNIIKTSYKYPTIIFFNKNNKKKMRILKKLKVKLVYSVLQKDGNFDLRKILYYIGVLGFSRVFLETGLNLTVNFFKKDLVDEFKLFISKKNLKSNGDNKFKKYFKLFLGDKKPIYEKINMLGDKLITYKIK